MNMKVSAAALAILGSVFAASSNAQADTLSISAVESKSVEAAQVLRELQAAGMVRIDSETGSVQLKTSVLEVLRATGWATEKESAADTGGGKTGRTYMPGM